MRFLVLFAALLACGLVKGQKFNREFLGVAFSPYTDHAPGRNWDQYNVDDIKQKLSVVRNYFSSISSYGMGTASYNRGKPWYQCDSNALVARAAAQLNQGSSTKLRVNIGVYQIGGEDQQREIDNAFAAAAEANSLAGGTVWGITFTNEYVHSYFEGLTALNMTTANKGRANSMGLRVGIRTEVCGAITGGDLQQIIADIVRSSDYIYCNVYPSNEHSRLGPERAAQEVFWYFLYLATEIRKVNGNIEVMIGETGWPSQGNSFNGGDNTAQNEVIYWRTMNSLAVENRVKVQMFEALDEPWKGDNSQFKAESYYGWWSKANNNQHNYREKDA